MEDYIIRIQVRWADLDPNFHMLHSKYYDLGAQSRISYMVEKGITPALMKEHNIGPIIFREECIFKREIAFGDEITINIRMKQMSEDGSRWTMVHEIWKKENILAALITCEGAWMDTTLRKLASPPALIQQVFQNAPRTSDFTIYTKTNTSK